MRHLIVRQILDLHLGSSREAFGTQQRLSRFFQEEAAPALERLFDRIAPPGKVVRIERLEVDLGFLQANQIDTEETLRKLVRAVEEAIQKALHSAGPDHSTNSANSVFLQWLYFLESGVLPWYAENSLPAGWQMVVLEQLGLDATAAIRLRRLLSGATSSLDRLIRQHSDDFLEAVGTLLTGRSHVMVQQVIQELLHIHHLPRVARQKNLPPLPDARETRNQLWKWVFANDFGERRALDMEALLSGFIRYRFSSEWLGAWAPAIRGKRSKELPVLHRLWPRLVAAEEAGKRKPAGAKNAVDQSDSQADGEKTQAADSARSSAQQPGQQEKREGAGQSLSNDATLRPPERAAQPEAALFFQAKAEPAPVLPDKEEIWQIANAGIVLANGYLTRFFSNLDLLKPDRQFRDAGAQNKAALLIHFLATGETEAPEYLLLLPKVLCGIPAGAPLEFFTPLDPSETEEALALLQAMIGHWEALGNTSADGLREGFLKRNGRLRRSDDGWRLQIERQTIDILLDRSPFGFNVIKLPWMKDPLRVEW